MLHARRRDAAVDAARCARLDAALAGFIARFHQPRMLSNAQSADVCARTCEGFNHGAVAQRDARRQVSTKNRTCRGSCWC